MTHVHILRVPGTYIGQVRGYGCRRWRVTTGKCKTAQAALGRAVRAMGSCDKRARAVFIPNDEWGYYEPHVAMEAKRK